MTLPGNPFYCILQRSTLHQGVLPPLSHHLHVGVATCQWCTTWLSGKTAASPAKTTFKGHLFILLVGELLRVLLAWFPGPRLVLLCMPLTWFPGPRLVCRIVDSDSLLTVSYCHVSLSHYFLLVAMSYDSQPTLFRSPYICGFNCPAGSMHNYATAVVCCIT